MNQPLDRSLPLKCSDEFLDFLRNAAKKLKNEENTKLNTSNGNKRNYERSLASVKNKEKKRKKVNITMTGGSNEMAYQFHCLTSEIDRTSKSISKDQSKLSKTEDTRREINRQRAKK